jgi:hypothetical protein
MLKSISREKKEKKHRRFLPLTQTSLQGHLSHNDRCRCFRSRTEEVEGMSIGVFHIPRRSRTVTDVRA